MKQGNVEIALPQKEQITICFTQVARMKQGEFELEFPFEESGVNLNVLRTAKQLEEAASELTAYVKEGFLVETDEEGTVLVKNLDEGVYLLNSMESESGKTMLPTLLYLPTWDEVEGEMLYDITVVPKYGEIGPKTGDATSFDGLIAILIASAVLLVCGIKKIIKKEECF